MMMSEVGADRETFSFRLREFDQGDFPRTQRLDFFFFFSKLDSFFIFWSAGTRLFNGTGGL